MDFNKLRKFLVTPVSKPRMTRSDRWKKRACTTKYWNFKDRLKELNFELPESGAHVIFHLPMPNSWSKKKKVEMSGKPHQSTPDCDNMLKAIMDAVYENDCTVWDVRISKYWADKGMIVVKKEE